MAKVLKIFRLGRSLSCTASVPQSGVCLTMYFGACGACGMHFPGTQGRVMLAAGVVGMAFPESMSISRSLKVPSEMSCERRSGGVRKLGAWSRLHCFLGQLWCCRKGLSALPHLGALCPCRAARCTRAEVTLTLVFFL
jgi:hypothetical protein